MADSNSKKPMALLLLVVVAVLVVIMVSGKGDEFAGHDKLTTEADCTAAKGDWKKAMVAVEAADEKACTEAEGTWVAGGDNGTPNDDSDDTADSCTKEAEAETCSAPDYAGITAEADCTAAKGTWEKGGDNGTPDDDSDDTKDVCKPWEATASN